MSHEILILRRAQKELSGLPKRDYDLLKEAVLALAQTPRPPGCRKLAGRNGWRIRAGDYRVIYAVDDSEKKVTILHIGQRQDAYR